jgi:hypothetical protein
MDNNEFMIVVGTIVLLIELFLHIWESPKLSTIFTFWFQRFNVQTLIVNVFFKFVMQLNYIDLELWIMSKIIEHDLIFCDFGYKICWFSMDWKLLYV